MRAIDPIRFLFEGEVREVRDLPPTTSVLAWLRRHAGRTGTKEGCAEGDCGACTVVVGELEGESLILRSVNACIQFLPTLDGKALFTVEGLARDGALHPVQQALVDCHGSQCGFCTPGFAMSLWGLYEGCDGRAPTDTEVRRAITGNLCRCTGYRPIIAAGRAMAGYPRVTFDRAAVARALLPLRRDDFTYAGGGRRFHAPRTLAALAELRAASPGAQVLAGGTDVGLWVTKQLRDLPDIIYTGEVRELRAVRAHEGALELGAAVSLNRAYEALRGVWPEMNELWERFASDPIRNAGTLGGNIANGSPIGDAMPALIALGATITLASAGGQRSLPLEQFYLGYQKKDLAADEVLASIHVPARAAGLAFRAYKLSKRFDSDISAVCAAIAMQWDGEGRVAACRIAFGGMAAIPQRARAAEAALVGKAWTETTVAAAMDALAEDFTPLTDMRATAGYRLRAARNLLRRFHLETRAVDPLSPSQVNVAEAA